MEYKQEDIKFKRDFLLINFNNTIELRTKNGEYLNAIKYWFLIVWNSALGFTITKNFYCYKMQVLLLSISLTFFLLHLITLMVRCYLQETITIFESFIMSSKEEDIILLNGPLYTLLNNRKRQPLYKHIKNAIILNVTESIFFYIIIVLSLILPIILK